MTGGPYDGQNWPTHSIAVWIGTDAKFIETARNYARLDGTGGELKGYVGRLLFDRNGLASLERRRITRDDVHTFDVVTEELSDDGASAREAFNAVNWPYVCTALLAE